MTNKKREVRFLKSKDGFTLIELLVVISIIALLLAIILPSLKKAKQQAQLVLCRNNLHQWAVAIGTFAADHDNTVPLSTSYVLAPGGRKVNLVYPNEMYLDQYDMHFSLSSDPSAARSWAEKMISHESIGPYLPGFNDLGLRTDQIMKFSNFEENFHLNGVWKCPSAKKQIGLTMRQITAQDTGYSFFRLDYTYIGRTDLWDDSMFPLASDRKALVAKQPSTKLMMMDTIFYWNVGNPAEEVYLYNHGRNGPSGEGATAADNYLQPPRYITGINQAFGDGSVEWKKINSNNRFRQEGFETQENRHAFLGYRGYLFF